MSLTSFIKQPDVRAGFRSAVTKPPLRLNLPLLAPPWTKHYGLVGGALDYLLRFHIERLNPGANKYTWVAYLGSTLLPENGRLYQLARHYLEMAEGNYTSYLETGVVTDNLLMSALRLATLDVVFRAGPGVIRAEHLEQIDPSDVQDLRGLMSIIPSEKFKASRKCILNPSFGWASHLVGGADADLIIDDTLIEIKTTKYLTLERSYIDQMIGYHILLKLSGISGYLPSDFRAEEYNLRYIAVYFARHGYLHRIALDEVLPQDKTVEFVKWFVERACQSERERIFYYKRFVWFPCKEWLLELRQRGQRPRAKRSERKHRNERNGSLLIPKI